jgi:hypothetical protein
MLTRRILSAFFLILMVLNTIGYYTFLVVVKDRLSQRTRARLESGMHDIGGSLIVKLPVALPYGVETSGSYESAHGEIVYEGSIYQRIKQRMYGDTLYVMCIRDYEATAAKHQIDRYSKTFAGDTEQQDSNTGIRIISSWVKYYFSETHTLVALHEGWGRTQVFRYAASLYSYHTASFVFHPPTRFIA